MNLVGGMPTPLKNMKSVGMMTFPTEWKNKIHVPNQQPGNISVANFASFGQVDQN
jgi:hypothetical protein